MGSSEEAKNYYAILGAAEDASQYEIERFYKRLAIRHHPDRGGDAECMKAINEAYQVLGNEAARRAYDASRNRTDETPPSITPPLSPPSSLLPNTLLGRLLVRRTLHLVRWTTVSFFNPDLLHQVYVANLPSCCRHCSPGSVETS